MANEPVLVLRLDSISAFNREMANLTKTLNGLDSAMSRVAVIINKLKIPTDINQSLAKLVEASNNLGQISLRHKSIANLSESITQFAKAVNKIKPDAAKNLLAVANAVRKLNEASNQPVGQGGGLQTLNQKINNVYYIINSLVKQPLDHKAVDEFIKTINKFVKLGKSLVDLANSLNAVPDLMGAGNNLRNFINSLASLTRLQNVTVPKSFVSAVKTLVDTFKELSTAKTGRFNLKFFSSPVDQLFKFIDKISSLVGKTGLGDATKAIQSASYAIRNIFASITGIMDSISKSGDIGRATKLQKALIKDVLNIILGMKDFITEIAKIKSNNLGPASEALRALTSFMNAMFGANGFVAALNDNPLTGVEKAIQPLLGLFGKKTHFTQFFAGFDNFTKLLSKGINNLSKVDSQGQTRAAATALRAIVNLINALFGENSDFLKVFKTIERANRRMTGFDKIANKGLFLIGKSTNFTRFLAGFQNLTKLIAKALVPLGKIKNLPEIRTSATVIRSLFEVIGVITKLEVPKTGFFRGNAADNFTKYLKGLIPLAKLLKDSINVFRKVKTEPTKLFAISHYIENIGKILKLIAEQGVIGQDRIKKFGEAIKEIASAINIGFSQGLGNQSGQIFYDLGVNAGTAFLSGMRAVMRIKSPSGAMYDIGQDTVKGFVNGVKGGARLLAGIAKTIGSAFIKAMRFVFTDGIKSLTSFVVNNIRNMGLTLEREMHRIGTRITQSGRSLFRSGLTGIATGGLAGFLQGATANFVADFSQVINQIGVFGKITGDTLTQVEADVLEFSAATKFAPLESAQALLGLQKAGLDTEQSLSALVDIGNLAAAANLDLATATDLAIKTMTGFGLTVKDLPAIVNTFVGGADISTATVDSLAQAIQFIGPSASQLKIPLADITAAIALLNDQAIDGERAGTGLRAILDSLASPTEDAAATLRELDISLADSQGNFVGMTDLVAQLQGAITDMRASGLGDVEIINQLSSLGDRNAISALFALIKEGNGEMITLADGTTRAATAYDIYLKNLGEANNAQTVANAQMDTFKGQMESLKGSIQTLIITALKPLLEDYLRPFLKILIIGVNRLSKLPKPVLMATAALIALSTALVTIIGLFQVMAGIFLFTLGPAISAVAALFTLVFNPVGIITTIFAFTTALGVIVPVLLGIVGALTILGGVAFTIFSDIRNNVGGAGDQFKTLLTTIKDILGTIGGVFGSLIDFADTFIHRGTEVQDTVAPAFGAVASAIQNINEFLSPLLTKLQEVKAFLDFYVATVREVDDVGVDSLTSIDELLAKRKQLVLGMDVKNFQKDILGIGEQVQRTYEIKYGDTFWGISRALDIPLEDILAANEGVDPRSLQIGQVVKLPGFDTTQPTADLQAIQDEIDKIDEEISLRRKLNIDQQQVSGVRRELSRIQQIAQTTFRNTSLFKMLFGEGEIAVDRAVAFIGNIEKSFANLATSSRVILRGFRRIFAGDIRGGLRDFRLAIGEIAHEISSVFETLFDVDIANDIQEMLLAGDLFGVFKRVARSVGEILVDAFLSAGGYIAEGIAEVFSYVLKKSIFGTTRFVLDLLGINTLDPVFAEIDKAINSIANFIETSLRNAFELLRGKISFDDFINNIFGLGGGGLKASAANVFGGKTAGFIPTAIQNLIDSLPKLSIAFDEFLRESGLKDINIELEGFKRILDKLNISFDGRLIAMGIDGLRLALDGLGKVIAFIGPIVKPFIETFAEFINEISDKLTELDEEGRLDSLAKGLLAMGAVVAIVLAPVLIPLIGTIAGVLSTLITVFVTVLFFMNLFVRLVDPVLEFFADLGEFVEALAKGDFTTAFDKLIELIGDLGQIVAAPVLAVFDTIIQLLEMFEELTGIDTTPIVQALQSIVSIIELATDAENISNMLRDIIDFASNTALGVAFQAIADGFELTLLKFQSTALGIFLFVAQQIETLLDVIAGAVNDLPIGIEIGEADLGLTELENLLNANQQRIDEINADNEKNNLKIKISAETKGLSREEITDQFFSSVTSGDRDTSVAFLEASGLTEAEIAAGLDTIDWASMSQKAIDDFNRELFAVAETASDTSGDPLENLLNTYFTYDENGYAQVNETMQLIGRDTSQGLADGITNNQDIAISAAQSFVDEIKTAISGAGGLMTNSPSLFTTQQGQYLVDGLVLGIQSRQGALQTILVSLVSMFNQMAFQIRTFANTMQSEMARAANAMLINAVSMQLSAQMIITSLQNIAIAAGAAMSSIRLVNATANGAPPPPPPNAPGFAGGGSTGNRNPGGFLATLHPNEWVVPENGALVIREDKRTRDAMLAMVQSSTRQAQTYEQGYRGYSGGTSNISNSKTDIQYGDINISIPPGTPVDGDSVKRALDQWHRENPPTRVTRNYT